MFGDYYRDEELEKVIDEINAKVAKEALAQAVKDIKSEWGEVLVLDPETDEFLKAKNISVAAFA